MGSAFLALMEERRPPARKLASLIVMLLPNWSTMLIPAIVTRPTVRSSSHLRVRGAPSWNWKAGHVGRAPGERAQRASYSAHGQKGDPGGPWNITTSSSVCHQQFFGCLTATMWLWRREKSSFSLIRPMADRKSIRDLTKFAREMAPCPAYLSNCLY